MLKSWHSVKKAPGRRFLLIKISTAIIESVRWEAPGRSRQIFGGRRRGITTLPWYRIGSISPCDEKKQQRRDKTRPHDIMMYDTAQEMERQVWCRFITEQIRPHHGCSLQNSSAIQFFPNISRLSGYQDITNDFTEQITMIHDNINVGDMTGEGCHHLTMKKPDCQPITLSRSSAVSHFLHPSLSERFLLIRLSRCNVTLSFKEVD